MAGRCDQHGVALALGKGTPKGVNHRTPEDPGDRARSTLDAAARADGMQVIDITGKAREEFLEMAFETAWNRLKASGSDHYEALREAYYDK